ncbi:kinase-like domain-containing protein [Baffinella frigidus]|nr:kinase-like domain-containing protein [Cryptophyta sp. CCMP2293]
MDDYEMIKQLAKGGQGTTSCVRRKSDNLKMVLKETECDSVRAGNDALKEAKTLQGLKHHSVVKYNDVFLNSANGYLVVCCAMELCNRGDLANYLFDKRKRQSPLNEQVVRSWLGQLTDALAYLHDLRILHRDLKPHNVFLNSEGVLKVGDFGLSATLEHGKRTSHVGTPCYLAPEVMNHEAYGEAVDMWGVGCIGYEMMTLEFLWEKKGLLAALVKTQPLKAAALPERFSGALRDCVVSTLQYNSGARPDAKTLLIKIRASKRGGGDDPYALALEGFGISDALSEVADSKSH